mgnify:CR=1 FL=1
MRIDWMYQLINEACVVLCTAATTNPVNPVKVCVVLTAETHRLIETMMCASRLLSLNHTMKSLINHSNGASEMTSVKFSL